MIFWE